MMNEPPTNAPMTRASLLLLLLVGDLACDRDAANDPSTAKNDAIAKTVDTKAADTKAADTKAADTKAADTKAADTKTDDLQINGAGQDPPETPPQGNDADEWAKEYEKVLTVDLRGKASAVAKRMAKAMGKRNKGKVVSSSTEGTTEVFAVRIDERLEAESHYHALVVRNPKSAKAFMLSAIVSAGYAAGGVSFGPPAWDSSGSPPQLMLTMTEETSDDWEMLCSKTVMTILCREGSKGLECAGVPTEEHVYTGAEGRDETHPVDCSKKDPTEDSRGFRMSARVEDGHLTLADRADKARELAIARKQAPEHAGQRPLDEVYREHALGMTPPNEPL